MKELQIAIIGTDTSHTVAFAKLLNDKEDLHHVCGGRITKALQFSSPDFELSHSREEKFSTQLFEQYDVAIVQELNEAVAHCDAILLLSADGRVHLEQFRQIVALRKPVFIDKPLALTLEEANKIVELAWYYDTPLMSSSALRYAVALEEALQGIERNNIVEVIVSCPLHIEHTQSRYFWYGIHGVEMLYRVLGQGCSEVRVEQDEQGEMIVGKWAQGASGKVVFNNDTNQPFELDIITNEQSYHVNIADGEVPFYASLLQSVMNFFHEKESLIPYSETLEVISFIAAAEESYKQKVSVKL